MIIESKTCCHFQRMAWHSSNPFSQFIKERSSNTGLYEIPHDYKWYSYLWGWGSCPWAVSYSRNCEGYRTFRPTGPLGSGIWWGIDRPHSDPHLGQGFWQDAAGVRCTLCTSGFCFGLQILTGVIFILFECFWSPLFVMCWLFCHNWWCDFCDVECWNER